MESNITIIKPRKGLIGIDFKELFKFKELFWVLSMKEIKVRYKQTLIGGLWAIIQPLLTMIVFTIFFGTIVKISSEGVPYAIFSYSGLILWIYFTNSLSAASNSTVSNASLISKIYFPRIILPISSTIIGLIDYGIAFIIMFGLMFYYGFAPTINLIFIPIILFFTMMLASGLGLWLSAINVKYRDVKYVIPFFVQLLIFVTPVIYPISLAGKFKWLLALNPMTGFIEAHRAMILGHQAINYGMIGLSIGLTIIIFITGLMYFNQVERKFADII